MIIKECVDAVDEMENNSGDEYDVGILVALKNLQERWN